MSILKKYINIILLAAALAVLGFGYFMFFGVEAAEPAALVATGVQGQQNIAREELLRLLLELKNLKLDETFFDGEGFKSLQDFSVELQSQPVGRDNPFLPFGSDADADTGEQTTAAE